MSFGAPLVLAALVLVPAGDRLRTSRHAARPAPRRRRRSRSPGAARVGRAAPPRLAPARADGSRSRSRWPCSSSRARQAAEDGRGAGRARVDHARDRRLGLDGGDRRQALAPRRRPPRGGELPQRRAARRQRRRRWRSTSARACCRARRPTATDIETALSRLDAQRRHRDRRRDQRGAARSCASRTGGSTRSRRRARSCCCPTAPRRRARTRSPPRRRPSGAKIPVYTVALGTPARHDHRPAPRRPGRHRDAARPARPRQPRADRAGLGRPDLHRRQRERAQARLPAARLAARHRAAQAPAHLELRRRRARAPAGRRRDVAGVVRAAGVNFENDKGAG